MHLIGIPPSKYINFHPLPYGTPVLIASFQILAFDSYVALADSPTLDDVSFDMAC
jgi:hypothetical protein